MLKKAMPVHQIQGPPLGHNLLNYGEEKEAMYHPNSHDALVLDGGLQYLPQAPERSTSSRAAVQRGLNAWHQYGLVDDPFFGTNGSQQYFPFHKGSSWQEKERSMEAVNMYMFDPEPLHTHVLTSQSPMPSKNSSAFQPHFPQTLARPSYQPEPTHYNSTGGPSLCSSASLCQSSQRSSFAYPITPSSDLHDRMYQVPPEHSPILQQDCSIYGRSIATPSPTFSLPSTIKTQNGLPGTEVSYPQDLLGTFSGLQKNNQRSSSSPAPIILPKEPEGKSDEEMLNLEGLVAHRVAEYNARIRGISKSMSFQTERHRSHSFSGSHSRTVTPDEPMLTVRRRTTSDSQYLLNQNDGMCASLKSMRPEFVKQISVNSGRQPTGRPIQSYIESCRDMELAPQVPVHRSDSYSGLSKFPLSASGVEAHSLAEALEQQTSLEPRGYMASVVTEGLTHHDPHLNSAEKLLAPVCAFSSPHLDRSATGSFNNQLGSVSGPIQPALISEPIIYLNPEEATVSIMGVHHIPGSPNTLHRTVATNTPPSPVLRQKLGGQRSPSLDQHLSPSGSDQKLPHKTHLKSSEKYEAQTWQSSTSLNRLGHGAPSVRFTPRTGSFSNNSEPDLSNHEENQAPDDVNRAPVPPSQTGIVSIYADGPPDITLNIKFVQDTSKFWYKPEISREQAICILKNREPGAFVIRDSNSFKGAYGLAMKIASPPPMVQLNKKVGDIANELVRHFLIESSSKGVRLKGCPNESYFGCLSALVYQHSITPLALPCKLMIPTRDPNEEALELATPGSSTIDLINQDVGLPKSPEAVYACNVLYINSVDMESLTGPQAVAKAITKTLAAASAVMATTVQFKMSTQGVTLTDNHRKVFFRRHYPVQYITSCNLDPQDRKWIKADGEAAKLFGLVARKQGSRSDNVTHVFAELEADKPVSAIVHFVSSVVLKTQKR